MEVELFSASRSGASRAVTMERCPMLGEDEHVESKGGSWSSKLRLKGGEV